jgi:hypothetical protein
MPLVAHRLTLGLAALAAASLLVAPAFAQAEDEPQVEPGPPAPPPPPPEPPAPPPPPRRAHRTEQAPTVAPALPPQGVVVQTSPAGPDDPPPPNVSIGPHGSVVVTQTPAGPVDVHAPTPDGMVHAYGCSRVEVDPRTRTPVAPVAAAPGQPTCPPYYVPYPVYPYPYPVYAGPYVPYYRYMPPPKPRYAPDPQRSSAIALGAVAFGVGTLGAGTWYLEQKIEDTSGFGPHHAANLTSERAALVTLGAAEIIPASIPRFVMGDVGMALLFSGLRAGSFAIGALPNWGKDNWAAPLTFAFAAPVALSIVDLATTPHREQMIRRAAPVSAKQTVHLDGIAPTVAFDPRGNAMPAIGALGRF